MRSRASSGLPEVSVLNESGLFLAHEDEYLMDELSAEDGIDAVCCALGPSASHKARNALSLVDTFSGLCGRNPGKTVC